MMEGLPSGKKRSGAVVYLCTVTGVKSVSCDGRLFEKSGTMCRQCTMVSVNPAFVKRLARTKGRISSGTRESTRINYITESIPVRNAVIDRRTKLRAQYRKAWRAGNTLSFVTKSRRVLHDRLMAQLHFKKYPQFIKQLIKAADSGLLCRDNHAFIVDLLTGLSTSLLNGSKQRRLSENERQFYKMLYMYGGPMVHNFVSQNLLGASISTSKRLLRKEPLLGLNTLSNNLSVVVELMKKYDLLGVPCLLGEDGSALIKHLDPVMETADDDSGDVIVVYGMNGGPVVVTSVDVLKDQFRAHGFATTLYVWDLIPLIEKAPHFPIKVATNANCFTHTDVLTAWKELWRMCTDMGINIVGHVSDGDPKLRAADFVMQQNLQRRHGAARDYMQLDHHLIQLSIPVVFHAGQGGAESRHPVCCLQDFLHVMWRLRVLYLKPRRMLFIGPSLASPDNLRRHMNKHGTDLGLRYSDLDERDKQNFRGCLRLFGFTRLGTVQADEDTIFKRLHADEGARGDILYLRFCHRFVRTFVIPTADVSPVASVRDMGYTITFLCVWRQLTEEHPKMSMKDNFLSRETYTDVLLTAMTVVLLVKVYRECYPDQRWVPRRFSSRFNEYIFSYLRLQLKGSPNFTAMTAQRLLRNLMAQLSGEAGTDVKFPDFKRGHSRGAGRCDFNAGKQESWPTDAEIKVALDDGQNECIHDLSVPFRSGQSTWGMLKNKNIKKYNIFDPKSAAFWKEASKTQLEMATDDELGKEYIAQLMQGYHLPNDWRKQFARHLPPQWRKQHGSRGASTNESEGDDSGSGGGSDEGEGACSSQSCEVPLTLAGTDRQLPVALNGGTGVLLAETPDDLAVVTTSKRAASLIVTHMADDSCSCTTHCGEDCENVLRFWECCEMNCSATICGNRLSTALLPEVYVKGCMIPAKGKGLFMNGPFLAGTCILRVTGRFRRAAPTGKSAHYTLVLRQTALPEGSQRKAPAYFTVTGNGMYINTGCTPNAEFRVVRNGCGKETVYVFLVADVLKDEEVVASYSMEEACECLCAQCVSNGVIGLLGGHSNNNSSLHKGVGDESEDSDERAEGTAIDLTVQKTNALKFEKAIEKCVAVASGQQFKATEDKRDTRTPLFIAVQEVCRTLNSHVDKQAHDRKFRFVNQLSIDAGAVKESTESKSTLSDGYVSVDNDVAYLFEQDAAAHHDGQRYKIYYGCIHGLVTQHDTGKGKVSRRVQSIMRSTDTGVAVMKWYSDCGVDDEGNLILEEVDMDKQERMSSEGIVCKVNLISTNAAGSNMQPRFKLAADDVAYHERIVKEYSSGKRPLGLAAIRNSKWSSTTYTVAQLKEQLRAKGLHVSGNKSELAKRLLDENCAPEVNRKKRKTMQPASKTVHSWGPEHMSRLRFR